VIWQKDYLIGGEARRLVLEHLGHGHYRLQVNGESFEFEADSREPGLVDFVWQGKRFMARGVSTEEGLQLRMDGRSWNLKEARILAEAPAIEASGDVIAPMTGTILQVHVAEGDEVKRGQALAVLSAMKMEHRLLAEIDGTVVDLFAEEGANVDQGDLMVRVEAGA
jgi:acetyl/propionyl-CoA carboxylase alpha subunit